MRFSHVNKIPRKKYSRNVDDPRFEPHQEHKKIWVKNVAPPDLLLVYLTPVCMLGMFDRLVQLCNVVDRSLTCADINRCLRVDPLPTIAHLVVVIDYSHTSVHLIDHHQSLYAFKFWRCFASLLCQPNVNTLRKMFSHSINLFLLPSAWFLATKNWTDISHVHLLFELWSMISSLKGGNQNGHVLHLVVKWWVHFCCRNLQVSNYIN